ncbi:MAG: hypothetical protein D6710_09870 [Nitrospirae bacterium]|nr:MAG: hypothetical protein D6710_09870 [Nitrospirota bacterium]
MSEHKRVKEILNKFLEASRLFARGFSDSATKAMEAELKELENTFSLVMVGSLVGLPAPASFVGVAVLPYMERELMVMLARSQGLDDRLAEFFGVLDFG